MTLLFSDVHHPSSSVEVKAFKQLYQAHILLISSLNCLLFLSQILVNFNQWPQVVTDDKMSCSYYYLEERHIRESFMHAVARKELSNQQAGSRFHQPIFTREVIYCGINIPPVLWFRSFLWETFVCFAEFWGKAVKMSTPPFSNLRDNELFTWWLCKTIKQIVNPVFLSKFAIKPGT